MAWPVPQLLIASADVKALVGAPPAMRVYEDTAPQAAGEAPPPRPYIVWGTAGGAPENYLSARPGIDAGRITLDVYADSAASRRQVVDAVMAAIEPSAHMITVPMTMYEPDTKLFRAVMDFQFWTHR